MNVNIPKFKYGSMAHRQFIDENTEAKELTVERHSGLLVLTVSQWRDTSSAYILDHGNHATLNIPIPNTMTCSIKDL